MEVPKRIRVDFPKKPETNHLPAGYYDDEDDDFESDDDDYTPPKPHIEPAIRFMSPPQTLTARDIGEEERHRFQRDSGNDSISEKTPNRTGFDPISVVRQVRHLHNRVRLLEDELKTQHNRQIFLFSVLSVYVLSKSIYWLSR